VKVAPLALFVSLGFAAACGRTELALFEPDANAGEGEGGSSRGGAAGTGTGGAFSAGGANGRGGSVSGTAGDGGGTGGESAGTGGESAGTGGAGRIGAAGIGGMVPSVCGDGIVAPGEACDTGSESTTPALELRQGTWRMPVLPVVAAASATTHYAYGSRSSHTGFEATGKSSLYLYRATPEAALSLVLLNGIDEDSSGMIQPASDIVFEIAGLPDVALVVISDDDVEVGRTTPTTARAEWDCDRNSDGGVIGGLPFPGTWHLTIAPSFLAGITAWAFLSGAQGSDLGVGAELSLDLSKPVEIVASDRVANCRADCTLPRCGDGILDPGEVCDDHNELPGDGCFDCRPEP
jgi:cysteine-rich repeat protein